MASNPVAQPTIYLDTVPSVSEKGDLFTVAFNGNGVNLKLTPHAMTGLMGKGKHALNDWCAISMARAAGYLIDDTAEIVAFSKRAKPSRRKGGRSA